MDDPFEDAARLITRVGECYGRAHRYRAIAGLCEERYLAPALAIGSELRTRMRAGDDDVAWCAAMGRELQRIIDECEAAVAAVHASEAYRAARRAWDAARFADVGAYAAMLFDGVAADPTDRPLYVGVAVTSARGAGEHFAAPAVVAERIGALVGEGVAAADPPPERGADECIRAVVLEDEPDAVASPITLELLPGDIVLPRYRLDPAGEVLVYAPRLSVAARVRFARTVSDEWWAVRPEAYAHHVAELTRELAARGIRDVAPR